MIVQITSTVNYLHYAVILIKSLRRFNPAWEYSVLVTDVQPGGISNIRDILGIDYAEILCCQDLRVDYLERMREYYSVLEFNAACKILALYFQLQKERVSECLCLDADMYALGNLENFFTANRHDIVLTPHVFSPYPFDGYMPLDLELIACGHINAGVVYFKKTDLAFRALDWLKENIKCNWFIAPQYGMHAEQQWLSALPFFFNKAVNVSFDCSVNIGYWNLHERNLLWEKGTYKINDTWPALLFHFSGFVIPSKGRLTTNTRRIFTPETEKTLIRLIEEYEKLLFNERNRLGSLKGDLKFCYEPLYKRMAKAEKVWGARYFSFGPPPGFFERIGHKLDRLL